MSINFRYLHSKLPLRFVFIAFVAMAVNLAIISGFQFMTSFQYKGPVSSETLEQIDSRFESCTILATAEDNTEFLSQYQVFLLETKDGETYAVTLEKHFAADRYRYQEDMTIAVPKEAGEQIIDHHMVQRSVLLCVNNNSEITSFDAYNWTKTIYSSFLIAVVMCAAELVMYGFIFKKEDLE